MQRSRRRQWVRQVIVVAMGVASLGSLAAACGDSDAGTEVTLLTHDSFALPDQVIADFEKQSGLTVKIARSGDAGQLASTISLTPGRPKADAVYGIDNTFVSRPISVKAFAPYRSPALTAAASTFALTGSDRDQLTPIDRGDVCVNVDTECSPRGRSRRRPRCRSWPTRDTGATRWSWTRRRRHRAWAFLLATIAQRPDTWQDYWRSMRGNDVSVVSGWETGYNQQFSGGEGKGPKPVVVSYASSPAANPATKALLNSCFRQVEYAGVLRGAANSAGAEKLIDFMLGDEVQRALPEAMYVYPVRDGVALPESWAKNAPLPTSTLDVPAAAIAKNRESWQQEWRTIMGR